MHPPGPTTHETLEQPNSWDFEARYGRVTRGRHVSREEGPQDHSPRSERDPSWAAPLASESRSRRHCGRPPTDVTSEENTCSKPPLRRLPMGIPPEREEDRSKPSGGPESGDSPEGDVVLTDVRPADSTDSGPPFLPTGGAMPPLWTGTETRRSSERPCSTKRILQYSNFYFIQGK